MPAMIVWPVSSSVRTWKVGSSSARRWIAVPSFSWSPLDFGSMATEMTGAGKFIDSRITGCLGAAQRVAGGGVLQTHARRRSGRRVAFSISSRLFACIR